MAQNFNCTANFGKVDFRWCIGSKKNFCANFVYYYVCLFFFWEGKGVVCCFVTTSCLWLGCQDDRARALVILLNIWEQHLRLVEMPKEKRWLIHDTPLLRLVMWPCAVTLCWDRSVCCGHVLDSGWRVLPITRSCSNRYWTALDTADIASLHKI